jgi:hypothetical protein
MPNTPTFQNSELRFALPGVLILLLGVAEPTRAQVPDMAAVQQWMASPQVTWHIVGKYDGKPSVTSDGQGKGQVTDQVEFDVTVDWMNENRIMGPVKIKNTPSVVTNLVDRERTCRAPQLNGAFEYATFESVTEGLATSLHIKVTTTYPEAIVSQVCSSTQVAPAKTKTVEFEIPVAQPTMLAMAPPTMLSPDKKSLVVKGNSAETRDWTWTMTPTPAPKRK